MSQWWKSLRQKKRLELKLKNKEKVKKERKVFKGFYDKEEAARTSPQRHWFVRFRKKGNVNWDESSFDKSRRKFQKVLKPLPNQLPPPLTSRCLCCSAMFAKAPGPDRQLSLGPNLLTSSQTINKRRATWEFYAKSVVLHTACLLHSLV